MATSSTNSRSRAWVEVDLDALCANAIRVQQIAGATAGLLPMVKADAYGLGAEPVVEALVRALDPQSLWGFGVAAVAEGEEIRQAGWAGRLIVFSPTPPGEYLRAAEAHLTLGLSDLAAVERWAGVAEQVGRRLPFHVELDTGMGRAGFPAADAAEWGPVVARIAEGRLHWEGCFTHFHSADEPDLRSTDAQWEQFQAVLQLLPPPADGEPPLLVHASNSSAAVRRPFAADLVRPGIFLYGGSVGAGEVPRAVAALRARIVLVREVPPGTTVGYGATYRATRQERWGTLAIGYGDGLRRALGPAGGEALVHGVRVPIVGRISMDMTVVDLTEVPDAEVGDVATLIGRDGAAEITLDEVASLSGTISYEILTGLTPRLPRVYIRAEDHVGLATASIADAS